MNYTAVESALRTTSSVLSTIGSLSIIITYLTFRELRHKPGRWLMAMLSVADLATAIVYVTPLGLAHYLAHYIENSERLFCDLQSLSGIYFPTASFLWTDAIAFFVYRFFVREASSTPGVRTVHTTCASICKSYIWTQVICWGLPLISVLLVYSFDWMGRAHDTGGWCWVRPPAKSMLTNTTKNSESLYFWETFGRELVAGKLIEILSTMVVCPMFYVLTLLRYRRQKLSESIDDEMVLTDENLRQLTWFRRKLVLVPLIFALVRVFGTVNSISVALNMPTNPIMTGVQAFCDPAQGFVNGLLFVVLSPNIATKCRRLIRTKCRQKSDDSLTYLQEPLRKCSSVESNLSDTMVSLDGSCNDEGSEIY